MKYIDAEKIYEHLEQVSELYPRYADNIVDNAVNNVIVGIKTFVTSLQKEQPEGLDEAARKELQAYLPQGNGPDGICYFTSPQMLAMYKAGAEQMAGQGVSMEITPDVDWTDIDKFVYMHSGDNVIIQIRKINKKEK